MLQHFQQQWETMGHSDNTNDGGILVPSIVEQPCGLYAGTEAFSGDYDADDYHDWVEQSNGDPVPAPLVVYLQDAACVDQRDQERAMGQELRMQGALFDGDRVLEQLILTGSIAETWSENQLHHLVSTIQASFPVDRQSLNNWCACVANTIPSGERLRLLRVLGFNHIRFALTASAPEAQLAITLADAVRQAKRLGFDRIILDLRRMPADTTLRNLLQSLDQKTKPDRIRMPLVGNQDPGIYAQAVQAIGFRYIGLDWYLCEDDSWWDAWKNGSLYWTMLGYSELHNPDVIGIGPGAISSVGGCYSLNDAPLSDYVAKLKQGRLPIVGGAELEPADLLRREIIAMILTSSCIRVSRLEEKWGIEFDRFFARESDRLRALERTNQVSRKTDGIDIHAQSQPQLIEICEIFESRPRHGSAAAAHTPSSKHVPLSKSYIVS